MVLIKTAFFIVSKDLLLPRILISFFFLLSVYSYLGLVIVEYFYFSREKIFKENTFYFLMNFMQVMDWKKI